MQDNRWRMNRNIYKDYRFLAAVGEVRGRIAAVAFFGADLIGLKRNNCHARSSAQVIPRISAIS